MPCGLTLVTTSFESTRTMPSPAAKAATNRGLSRRRDAAAAGHAQRRSIVAIMIAKAEAIIGSGRSADDGQTCGESCCSATPDAIATPRFMIEAWWPTVILAPADGKRKRCLL